MDILNALITGVPAAIIVLIGYFLIRKFEKEKEERRWKFDLYLALYNALVDFCYIDTQEEAARKVSHYLNAVMLVGSDSVVEAAVELKNEFRKSTKDGDIINPETVEKMINELVRDLGVKRGKKIDTKKAYDLFHIDFHRK